MHEAIRDDVRSACASQSPDELSAVVGEEAGDTIFAIDRVSESALLSRFGAIAEEWPCLLVAEGLGDDGRRVLPGGASPDDIEIVVLVDPIDGTRGLMYQKRPAWILTGVAPSVPSPTLADVQLAVQTEIPLQKQHLADVLWAEAGHGAAAERCDLLTGRRERLALCPSRANTIAQSYGGLARFFPGARDVLAAVDDEIVESLLGKARANRALTFEDQYISTGGQLYELMMGHDRWIADLRPLVQATLRSRGLAPGMCCHPYDLATELIAREVGVVVTDVAGAPLSAALDVFADVAWTGYANRALADQVAPALRSALARRGLL